MLIASFSAMGFQPIVLFMDQRVSIDIIPFEGHEGHERHNLNPESHPFEI